jgi:hypothetical protein
MPHTLSGSWTRLSASMLPLDVDPEEREYVHFLERALAPSFTLVNRLGAGAMGAVYLARDPVLKRLVAVKALSPALAGDPEARARFEREARAVASITHPNVVAVYSVGALENGVPYFVMQYVQGRTVAERIQSDGPLDVHTAERVLGEIASALAAAHRKGIIHRDIKPANILWDDESGRALLTDFGIAAVRETGEPYVDESKLTQTGMAIGTPQYMSPEQLLAEAVTEKTDVYSFGLLGYELLIGEGPYKVDSPREMMAAHLRDAPRRLSTIRGDVEAELERLLESCLAKDPAARPSAREVEDRLMHGATVLLEWPPPGLEPLRERFRGTLKALAFGSATLAVPLVALTTFERGSRVRDMLPPFEFLVSLAAIGLVIFLAGCVRLVRFVRVAGRAVDGGYKWGTIAETVADERGDTGALITGAREYATLTPAGRSRYRLMRVIRAALFLAATLAPVLGYGVAVLVAARFDSGPMVVLSSSLLLSAALFLVARGTKTYEKRSLRAARQRKRPLASVDQRPAELAQAWTNAFDQVRSGQRMGAGPGGRRKEVVRTAVGIAAFAGLVAVLGNLLLVLTTILTIASGVGLPTWNATRERFQRIERLSALVVPPDSSVTALRAGQALHSIARAGGAAPRSRFGVAARPTQRPITKGALESTPAFAIDGFDPPDGRPPFGDSTGIADAFRVARGGLSDTQRRYLRRLSENPALREFRLAANAPALDIGAAMWRIPPGTAVSFYELPGLRGAPIRNAARSNLAAAALELSTGQPRDAERRIREVISVGFLLIRHGAMIFDNLVGAALVNEARQALESFYQATSRPNDARFVSSASDPTFDATDVDGQRVTSLDQMLAESRRVVFDSTAVRGLRWELLLNSYAYEPCSDMRQIVFGADSTHRATIGAAQRALTRHPSDSILFAIASRPMGGDDAARGPWPGRIVSALTGNRVFESCMILIGLK